MATDADRSFITTLIILQNLPTFQNQSPGWAENEGYQLWVCFSDKGGMSFSLVSHVMCVNRGCWNPKKRYNGSL